MKKILILLTIITFFSSCIEITTVETENADLQNNLQKMLANKYDSYLTDYPEFNSGFALQLKSKSSNYFATIDMDNNITNRIHLRTANTTKTFTSAAFILLGQRGLLSIRNTIADIILCGYKPFIPYTPELNIPGKGGINAKYITATSFDESIPLFRLNEYHRRTEYLRKSVNRHAEKQWLCMNKIINY